MSNERKDPEQDQLVAETYRDVARERVPDHLNERVLRLAADAGRSRYARARAWMRPAAWAATVGLSLAIVLELTQLPQVETVPVGITSSDESTAPGEADIAAEMQAGAPSPDVSGDRDDVQHNRPATPAARQQDRETMQQFAPKDMSVLREAENRARLQAGPDQTAATTAAEAPTVPATQDLLKTDDAAVEELIAEGVTIDEAAIDEAAIDEKVVAEPAAGFAAARSLSAVVDKKEAAVSPSCPSETRENAESWYRCIEELRDRGLDELANSEYENFQQIFPDFVDPDTDK